MISLEALRARGDLQRFRSDRKRMAEALAILKEVPPRSPEAEKKGRERFIKEAKEMAAEMQGS